MSNISLIWLLALCTLISHLDATKGIFIFSFPRSFHHPAFQQSSDQANTNDDDSQIGPFPSFLSFFRQRSPDLLIRTPEEEKENKDNKTENPSFVEKHEGNANPDASRVSKSLNDKLDAVTDHARDEKSTSVSSQHKVGKRFMEAQPFERYYDPLSLLYPFRHLHSRHSGNYRRNEVKEGQKTEQNVTQRTHLATKSGNITEATLLNSFTDRDNCTRTHFIARYFFVWRFNWASFIMHLIVILLISVLLSTTLFLCRPFCFDEQRRIHVKPLIV